MINKQSTSNFPHSVKGIELAKDPLYNEKEFVMQYIGHQRHIPDDQNRVEAIGNNLQKTLQNPPPHRGSKIAEENWAARWRIPMYSTNLQRILHIIYCQAHFRKITESFEK